ncbi:MAG TPA: Gfo/Idh/MocA family oxidoreductase [Gemmatimonadaceae bacterium]
MSSRKALRFGMVGGGPGAFIGAVHNRAATVDGLATLVAGAFSSDAAKSREQGDVYRLAPERVYASFGEMAEREAALPKDVRIDFVSIVTPNHLHFPVAKAFVERGFHVVCDKPLTTTLEDAEELCRLVKKHDVVFALTHPYVGYPMVKQARALVQDGALGTVRKILVEYSQGWLATRLEETGQKQAGWRTDPARAGAGAIGDIGTHAEHLARYVTGLEMEELFADVSTFVPGRRIDDDANMLVHYTGGAKGMLSCSQIAVGEENRLTIRVYGTTGSLEWKQEDPNFLYVRHADRPMEVYKPGHAQLVRAAQHGMRMPAGHPEGLLEAFANIYGSALRVMAARRDGDAPDPLDLDFPTVRDGATGVHFIQSALESGRKRDWVDAAYSAPE